MRNPGRGSFERCVKKVSRKGVDDPAAVCAAVKRKAGEELNPGDDITDRAKRYRARAHPPAGESRCCFCGAPDAMDIHHVNGREDDDGEDNKVWSCRSCNTIIANVMRRYGLGKLTRQYNPSGGATTLGAWMNAVTSLKGEGGTMDVSDAVALVRATSPAQRSKFAKEIWRIRGRRGNPADLAAQEFERTHGYPPEGATVLHEEEHYHEYMPAWGELMELVIVPEGQSKGVKLHSFDGAKLMFSESTDLPQLEIWGGDQSIDSKTLRDSFGVTVMHEKETLGKCVDVVYNTVKTHLGRDGGDADFYHRFAEETAGKKRRVRILNSPTATYDAVNRKIYLWGGVYQNTPEGIRN